jgi:hypothetical protein
MLQMARIEVMTGKLAIRPLGLRRNGHNCIDEGLSSVGEICYTAVYLFRRLLHQEQFCELYPSPLIATTLCLLRSKHVLLL